MTLETIRALPDPKATPVISIDFSPHKEVYVYEAGAVEFPWSNTFYAHINEVVTFTATVVMPTGKTIAGYKWEFGDGSEGSGNPSTHTYLQASININCVLTVTDNNGVEWIARKTMYLK